MGDLRVWQLSLSQPHALQIAADVRLSSTDYGDDQTWELRPGLGDAAALALQTRYGGRAGLVSLVPMWHIDQQIIYQAAQYAAPVTIRGFAPAFVQVQTRLNPSLALLAEFWVMDSHAVGGRFSLRNLSKQAVKLRLDLLGFVGNEGREVPLRIIPMPGEGAALSLGTIGNLFPMVRMDGGFAAPDHHGNKISTTISVAANGRASVRFVCAALTEPHESLKQAQRWLGEDWGKHFKRLFAAGRAIPQIETGDPEIDAVIAFGYQQLVQAFLKPTPALTDASFVRTRQPETGYSPRGTGKDYPEGWSGQDAATAYLAALAIAPVDKTLAQGLVRNFLTARSPAGTLDFAPGLAGQRRELLPTPLLARMAWSVFQYTDDLKFLQAVYPELQTYFADWLTADHDRDGDGAPEWQHADQVGYLSPLLAGQPLNANTVESPGLIAYLLSEAISLREMAYFLRDADSEAAMKAQIERLQATLETFWHTDLERYTHRDRDTHTLTRRLDLLMDGAGDETHLLAFKLDPPSRLIIEIEGGLQHTPKLTLKVRGSKPDGSTIDETATEALFSWRTGRGFYTTQTAFAQVDSLQCEGLVRVYRVSAFTPDLTGEDVDSLLPLWSVGLPADRAAALVRTLTDPQRFWRPFGVPTTYHGAEARVFPYLITLLGEGLFESGYIAEAAELVKRLLNAQRATLKTSYTFAAYYDADQARGFLLNGDLAGLPPLHLLLRVLGVRIVSRTKVWTGGAFAWGTLVRLTQHGVTVQRSAEITTILFPSGHTVTLPPDAPWQEIVDATKHALGT